jgi:nucleoside-diphosphate-sugar epimerase
MIGDHVLVTGGSGFIGSNLIRELNAHGYTTSNIDYNDNHSVTGESYVGDILLPGWFDAVVKKSCKPDQVVHLAAQVGREFGEDDIRHTIRENAEMTAIVAKTCLDAQIPLDYASKS